ncbi:MAG TPA: VirB3 family type IV secretion system protein [Hyphomonadaceae bacterium]|jgi:type IV secretion system protein VirB3|nr:VirB3 family type IV secretion system protein [Hyphomonadaceae bacterium]
MQDPNRRDIRDVPGFLAPVRQALTAPLLMGGAPRSYAILNGTLAAIIAFAGAIVPGILLGVAGHVLGVMLARRDPDAVEVLQRAMRIPNRLED